MSDNDFTIYVVGYMILFKILEIISNNFQESTNFNNSYSKQWIGISTITTLILGITPIIKYGIYNCIFLNSTTRNMIITNNFIGNMYTLSLFVAYLWYDLLFNILNILDIHNIYKKIKTLHKTDIIYICHHLLCTLPMIWFVFSEYALGIYFSEILLISELSTVFLNLKLATKIYKNLNNMFSFLFMITFLIVRSVFMPIVLYQIYMCFENSYQYYFVIGSFLCLIILNMYWTILIISKIKYYYRLFYK